MATELEYFGLTDPGSVRGENQDRILMEPDLGLFAVCDGMGGHRDGALAAEIAVQAVLDALREAPDGADAEQLIAGIHLANERIWEQSGATEPGTGMGSTVAVVLAPNARRATVANVGDSRVYHLRDGELRLISTDDTLVASLVAKGTIPASAAPGHPMRHILLQAAGSTQTLSVHVREQDLEPGDLLMLCSDGLYGVVNDEVLAETLAATDDLERTAADLLGMAKDGGAPDNVSIVLLRARRG
jgi:protein phosphatase